MGFTIVSITLSLIAVFLPILLMGGIVGRLFREFAVTLSLAILVSLVISLTTTPMLCALFLRPTPRPAEFLRRRKSFGQRVQEFYGRTLAWALDHDWLVLAVLAATVVMNVALLVVIPKGFFPTQDTGRLIGQLQADQSISFQSMSQKLTQMMAIVQHDPAVADVVGFTGAGGGGAASQTNTGSVFVALKPKSQRASLDTITGRLRRALARVPGGRLILVPAQDIRVGGRQTNAAYQYTVQADNVAEVFEWAPKLLDALQKEPALTDVNSDQQQAGLETLVTIDRPTASRLGITAQQVDNTLYDAFGQRSVSTIYNALNQYHVVMEVAPEYWQDPAILGQIWVSTAGGTPTGTAISNAPAGTVTQTAASTAAAGANGFNNSARNASQNALASSGSNSASSGAAVSTGQETMVPLAAVAKFAGGKTALSVNHQSQFVSATISFNLAPGRSLSDAQAAIDRAVQGLHMPADIVGGFAGTAQVFQQSLNTEGILVAAALLAVYIVLGVLYESFIHPITILSTLPSAGIGAVLALVLLHIEFSLIAVIGVILLIGIVKKNAILMIDFALNAERVEGLSSREAIFQACLMRLRPITMTTAAALLGALPLALGVRRRGGTAASIGHLDRRWADREPVPHALHHAGGLPPAGPAARALPARNRAAGGRRRMRIRLSVCTLLALAGCSVGPNYHRPAAAGVTAAFKEAPPGWTAAQPQDTAPKGAWWTIYGDPVLDDLEGRVAVSNQNVKQFEAQLREAQATVDVARSALFPTVNGTASVTRVAAQPGRWHLVRRRRHHGHGAGRHDHQHGAGHGAAHGHGDGRHGDQHRGLHQRAAHDALHAGRHVRLGSGRVGPHPPPDRE